MTLEIFIAILFGLLFGSFLNVCIYRLPRDLSVVWPGSHCLDCGHFLAPRDNIPVVSYLMLGGRCRYCRTSIHWRYPLVESITAFLFGLGVYLWGPTPEAAKFALFAFLLVGMIFSDLETRLLPDEFTKGGIVLGLLVSLVVPMKMALAAVFLPHGWLPAASLIDSVLGAALMSGALWGLGAAYSMIRQREGMGFGDVKMVAMIGAFLGLAPALMTMFVGCISASVLGLGYIFLTKKDMHTYELPFGSFLGASALLVAVWAR